MLFLALANVRSGTINERIGRRVDWQPPEGLQVLSEYWLPGGRPNVVQVIEAPGLEPILAAIADWDDVLDIQVFPALTAEQGLEMAKRMKEKVYVGKTTPAGV